MKEVLRATMIFRRFSGVIIFFLLSSFYFVLFAEPIDLVTLDLGRHLVNGRLFFEEFFIPSTNLYSFSHPDFPFVNHHWGSGVIFYGVEHTFGFIGLSLFAFALAAGAFFFFFHVAWRHGGLFSAAPLAALLVPLLAHRNDIRPELFSYFFCGAFFWILWNVRERRIPHQWLFILPFLEILWVNLHIYFILGIGLVGAFFLDALFYFFLSDRRLERKKYAQLIFWILFVCILAAFLNPFGASGALLPFRLFGNYGYRVLENQSVWFIHRVLGFYPASLFFVIAFGALVGSWVVSFMRWKKIGKKPSLVLGIFSLVFSSLGWLAIRNFALFGYFMLPIAAINFASAWLNKTEESAEYFGKTFLFTLLVFAGLLLVNPLYWKSRGTIGLGLSPGSLAALSFFQENNLRGPLFNNYDIGGYLIYGLYPRERVFVDNRPEAYPAEFFESAYVPMQENDSFWKEQGAEHNFNIIFFYRRDATPWAQSFLIRRVSDPEWAPVFVDTSVIIFARRTEENKSVIQKHEIPREVFLVQ